MTLPSPDVEPIIVEPILINPIDDGGEVMSDPDDGGEVMSDPDDGGEIFEPVAVIDGLRDDFDATVATLDMPWGNDDISPTQSDFEASLSDRGTQVEDLFGESITTATEGDAGAQSQGWISEVLAEQDMGLGDGGMLAYAAAQQAAMDPIGVTDFLPDTATEIVSTEVADATVTVEETVSDVVEEPANELADMADDAQGTVAGIADDIGL